jgi:DNA-binding NarL/FixJ family response regulator
MESQLLAMLAAGLTDRSIARRLDVSHRTAQKRVQELMDSLGADTRFQAGLQAKARGWL